MPYICSDFKLNNFKKAMKKIFLFALVAVSVVACQKKEAPMVGTWVYIPEFAETYEVDSLIVNQDSTATAAIVQKLQGYVFATTDTITLNADGTATICAPQAVEATYTAVDSLGTIQIVTADYIVDAAYTLNATADTLTVIKTIAPEAIYPYVKNYKSVETYAKTK